MLDRKDQSLLIILQRHLENKYHEQYQEFKGKNQEEEKNLSLDMLQQLLELKESLGIYMMEVSLDWMVPQWSIIEKLVTFLQPFKDAT
uniref:Uncharacterized protein n=1 Tax=Romanomermis culicivorax TaxID=13658 RepID=A0A915JNI4_ROMCU